MSSIEGKHILGIIGGTELLGAERGMIEALSALCYNGAHITVAVSARKPGGGQVGEQCRELGFETFEIPFGSHFAKEWMRKNAPYRNAQFKRLFTNSSLFQNELERRKPDLLLIGSTLAYAFLAIALWRDNTPLIYRVGDAPIRTSKFQSFLWKRLLRRSQGVVAISNYIKCTIETDLSKNKQVTVIRNIAPKRSGQPLAEQLDFLIKKKKPVQLVYVGQITPQKGVPELVQAILECNSPNLGCWIIGGSEHSKKLEHDLATQVIKSNSASVIEFLGFQSDPRPYLISADFHIAPSQYQEPLGNVVQEAKAQGTPSIVTPNGGLPETLTHGKTGVILSGSGPEHIQITLADALRGGLRFDEAAVLEESNQAFSASIFRISWTEFVVSVLNAQS